MPRGRPAGAKNKNYPPIPLKQALQVAERIEDQASGTDVSRLTLSELLDVSPSSSNFRDLIAASRMYGLTNGGIRAEVFSLTDLGRQATSGDEDVEEVACKQAVLNIEPYGLFFRAFNNKKVPAPTVFKEYLAKSCAVPSDRLDECMKLMLEDAQQAGLVRTLKGGASYVDLDRTPTASPLADPLSDEANSDDDLGDEPTVELRQGSKPTGGPSDRLQPEPAASKPKKVFIAHGKNRVPLEQLKTALDTFKVSYAVAVDEPNQGRPISRKVANLMRDECSSGVFIFTADERFVREVDGADSEEVWRPSENLVYELGAASILYENRIVIFKEKGVTFPTDFSDLGYIEFDKDQLVAELGNLFKELVALEILEVRAKG